MNTMAKGAEKNREPVKVNAAQHRQGWTIDNEENVVELAFCYDRDWANELARRWNAYPNLLDVLQEILRHSVAVVEWIEETGFIPDDYAAWKRDLEMVRAAITKATE